MIYKDKNLDTYPKIIDYALSLSGDEQAEFIEEYAKTGLHALANVGYFSGYYSNEKADEIMRVFKTAHPIFGTRHPSAEECMKMGVKWAKKK